jgi:hypothetical protein
MNNSVIVKFESRVFLHRPRSVMSPKNSTYLLVGEGPRYKHFLSMESGIIDVIRVPKMGKLVEELKPYNKYSLKHAAEVYAGTTLQKSSLARRILRNIMNNRDDSRVNFLPVEEHAKAEKPTKQERIADKANEITLEQICKEMKLDPKFIRGLFRENDVKKPSNRWTWPKGEREKIVKLIKSLEPK